MLQSRNEQERETERAAYAKLVDEKRKGFWSTLLKELRAANPTQKIAYRSAGGSGDYVRNVVIDSVKTRGVGLVEIEIRLNQESGSHSFFAKPVMRRFYFTIGAYRLNRGARPRAVEKKAGFDWARICQLVEDDRLWRIREDAAQRDADAREKSAEKQLNEMFKRRPDLRAVESLIEIAGGKFNVEARCLDIQNAEIILSAALRAQEKQQKEEKERPDGEE